MSVNPEIITRIGKGSPLTNSEVDQNFTNLKDDLVAVSVQLDDVDNRLTNSVVDQEVINTTVDASITTHEARLDDVEAAVAGVNGTLSQYIKSDGTIPFTGNVNVGGNRIESIAVPSVSSDAANKGYVDTTVSGVESALTADIINLSNLVNSIDYTQFIKKDGSVPLDSDLSMNNHRLTFLSQPTASDDATPKNYVLEKMTFKVESIIEIDSNDCASGELIPSTYAYEISGTEICDKLVFDNLVDADTINFPNKSYRAKIRYQENYSTFSDGIVSNKIVNRSIGKLVIDVESDAGVKLCTIPPKSTATLEWKGNSTDPVWIINIEKQEIIKPAASFTKAIIVVDSAGTIKANHKWVGKNYLDGDSIQFTITHTIGSGIYDISWDNTNSHNSNILHSPVVIPTLVLTSADVDDYRIYVKDVTTSGCSIHIKDTVGYTDKEFSLMIGGHNSVDGNSYDNPFLV
jgi:hypothetical protein